MALELAFLDRKVSVVRLALWKEELRDLIRNAAKKFVGFQNVESLRKALDIVLGLISVALVDRAGGKEDPARWAEIVVASNFKDLVRHAVGLAEAIHHGAGGKPYAYLFELTLQSDSTKDLLVLFATAREKSRWAGHDRYRGVKERVGQAQAEDRLVRWLLAHLLKLPPGGISSRHPLLEDAITADEVVNAMVFRYVSGLGFGAPGKSRIALRKEHFVAVREKFDADKERWLKAAKKRHGELIAQIPEGLRRGLGKDDWFATHLKSGPPKVSEKTKDVGANPSIEGVYFLELVVQD